MPLAGILVAAGLIAAAAFIWSDSPIGRTISGLGAVLAFLTFGSAGAGTGRSDALA